MYDGGFFRQIRMLYDYDIEGEAKKKKQARAELNKAVSSQIKVILRENKTRGWKANHEELPKPPVEEQDTYAYQFAVAARNCTHEHSTSTMLSYRERKCMDCGQYFTAEGLF